MNPAAVEGQMHGGIAQGLGLALMEEIQVSGGHIRNPSFTDYLLPTALDIPAVRLDILEIPRADSPYGLTGVGEPSLVSCPHTIVAAIRDAVGASFPGFPCGRTPLRGRNRLQFLLLR